MSACNILFAGFGGQGILFAGKFVAYKGLLENKQVSWLPSIKLQSYNFYL